MLVLLFIKRHHFLIRILMSTWAWRVLNAGDLVGTGGEGKGKTEEKWEKELKEMVEELIT